MIHNVFKSERRYNLLNSSHFHSDSHCKIKPNLNNFVQFNLTNLARSYNVNQIENDLSLISRNFSVFLIHCVSFRFCFNFTKSWMTNKPV